MRTLAFFVLSLALPWGAAAQDTVTTTFDFEAPGADQVGDYTAGPGAELASSLARTAARADWGSRAQLLRVPVDVDNPGAELTRPVFQVGVADLPTAIRSAAAFDGRDVTASASDGTMWDRPVASGVSMPSARGLYHVRAPLVAAGSSSFFLYAGDRAGAATVDELTFFTEPAPTVRYFVTGAYAATEVQIVSMVASNQVVVGGTMETLGAQEGRNRMGAALGSEITAAGPIAASWIGAGGDALPPESLAGTEFVIPSPRYDEDVFVVAAFGAATLTFDQPALGAVNVAAGAAQQIASLVLDPEAIVFSSDVPVVAVRGSVSGDITPIPPAATELVGVVSGSARVAAGAAGANLTYYRSDGTNATLAVPANGEVSLSPGGAAQGSGPAIRVTSDAPIGALTYGDGDGGEAIAWLPPELLGSDFVMPLGAQFVIVATALPNTTCRLLRPDGSELDSQTSGAFAPPHPGKIFFGNGTTSGINVVAPNLLRCDAAAWAAFEDGTSETEKILFSSAAHRAPSDASVTVGATAETRFEPGVVYVETPDLVLPRPAIAIEAMRPTEMPSAGGALGYQVSTDGGLSWRVPEGGALRMAAADEHADAASFAGATFPASETVRVRALLETDGRADPTVDAVELEARLVPPPTRFLIDAIASPQRVGEAFTVMVSAVDASGTVVAIDGTVDVTGVPAEIFDPLTADLTDGQATFAITPLVGAAAASVSVRLDDLVGGSNEFEIISASDTLGIAVASGDAQVGAPGRPLPEPLVVLVTDGDGAPLEGMEVRFELGSTPDGDASLSRETAMTDADGLAQTTLTLGGVGEHSVLARPAADPSLSVAFRASAMEAEGCDCRAMVGRPGRTPPAVLWGLLGAALLYRKRRR